MRKLAKYLKPFTLMLICILGLLFVQALTDLNLPNYMSDIVNTGIQQGGIHTAVPAVITEDGMKLETVFMTDGDQQLVEDSYTLIAKGDPENIGIYPALETTNVYRLNDVDEQTQEQLNRAFSLADWTIIKIMKEMAPGDASGQAVSSDMAELDFTQLYQMLPQIEQIPQEKIEQAREKAEAVPVSTREQTGAAFVKIFYKDAGLDVAKIQNDYILKSGLIMLAIALIGVIASILVGLFASKVAAGMARDIRRDVFKKVESFSPNEFHQFSTASLITRTTNDITQIQLFITMGVRMLLYAPIMGVGGVIMALSKSVSMAWVIAVAVIVMILVILGVFLLAMPKFKIMQKLIDKLNLVARENLSGLLVIRAFGTQKYEEKRFDNANQDLSKTSLFINRVMVFMMPAMMLVMNMTTLLIVWVGAQQVEASAMQVGDMMAYMQYAMMIIMAFLMVAMMFIMIPRASVSASRISEVLETRPTVVDPDQPKPFCAEKRGVVEFKDVHFKYEGAEEDVLCGISFTARPGQTTAIIGATGSGKSTLINLVPRFYDVSHGQVLVSGVDVREVGQHDLREQIGYVPQKGTLFSGTIASNLSYGKKGASWEEMEQAAEIAQAQEFVAEKEQGLAYTISEGGSNVSGGQKQRLSIARALVKNAPVYIFDDSFSALDAKTDAKLRKALKPYTQNSTVLVVAQKVSSILHADQIIVLDEGRIVGRGTHEELMQTCPTYVEIAQSQLGGDAL